MPYSITLQHVRVLIGLWTNYTIGHLPVEGQSAMQAKRHLGSHPWSSLLFPVGYATIGRIHGQVASTNGNQSRVAIGSNHS